MKKYLPLLFGLFLLTSSYQCLSLSRGLEKDLKELENQLNVLMERLQELQPTKPNEKKDITKDPRYIALTNASSQNIETINEDELRKLVDDYTQLKMDIDDQKFNIQNLPTSIVNFVNKIDYQLKKRKEKDKEILKKMIEDYDQTLVKVNKDDPVELRNKLVNFYKKLITRKSGIVQEKTPEISAIIDSVVAAFIPLYKIDYQYFKNNVQKILNLFELIIKDTKNWFDKKNMYKGKGIPYVHTFIVEDYERYLKVIENYEKLLEIPGIDTSERKQFLNRNKVFLKTLELWKDLPPTITSDYSPLEEVIIKKLQNSLAALLRMSINEAQKKKNEFTQAIDYLRIATYRKGDRNALVSYAPLYQKIMGEPLTWSQDFSAFQKQQKGDLTRAENEYRQAKANYLAKPIAQRTEDDYEKIREAIRYYVEYKAPNQELFEFYSNIGKEEPEEWFEEEEEEFEQETEKEEELKEELDELQKQFKQGTLNTVSLTYKERQEIKKKIEEYRKLSGSPQAYFKLYLAVGVQ